VLSLVRKVKRAFLLLGMEGVEEKSKAVDNGPPATRSLDVAGAGILESDPCNVRKGGHPPLKPKAGLSGPPARGGLVRHWGGDNFIVQSGQRQSKRD
jgi:hypothetical protein